MKALFVSALAAVCSIGVLAGKAHAQQDGEYVVPVTVIPVEPVQVAPVEIPKEVSNSKGLVESIRELRAVRLAELSALVAQNTYYNMMLSSFEAGYWMSKAFESEASGWVTAGSTTAGTVTVVMDYALVKYWLRGAIPTASLVKDIWSVSRGEASRVSAFGQKTWLSLTTIARELRVPKNFLTTATLGTFAYVHYENFWVMNMSETQYRNVIEAIKEKMAHNDIRRAAIADTFTPAVAN